ncbi:MAG: YeeE/YedE family protein [Opitutaceae bacterium]|nr:YeeE/YedE family protein [Opitutaceae bacterium]
MSNIIFPIIGGAFIGVAVISLMLILGHIMGISGLLWAAVSNKSESNSLDDKLWRWTLIIGLPLGTLLAHSLTSIAVPEQGPVNIVMLLTGAFLVGFGTKLGNGCTSGHGVCGIGRLSIRSLVATVIFILVAMITVYGAGRI